MKLSSICQAVLVATLVLGPTSFADEVKVYGENDRIDPEEIARILKRSKAPRMRGMRGPVLDTPSAFSVPVHFDFNSSVVLPQGKTQLAEVAKGIKLAGDNVSLVIEGHTDGKGDANYNQRLSMRRAEAVREFLVNWYGIPQKNVKIEGHGMDELINAADPYAAENRRVQFRALP